MIEENKGKTVKIQNIQKRSGAKRENRHNIRKN